jgi:hypothetical protein
MSFLPYSKLHAKIATVTLAKDCMLFNHNNLTIKNPKPLLHCMLFNHNNLTIKNPKPLLRKAENHNSN